MPQPKILGFFAYTHLPERLQAVSKPFSELALKMDAEIPESGREEYEAGLRKLLEAKDCFVRAALAK